ncbi:MAG: hypothetical protein US86_C0003G0032 [Candidatus Daviesbacteria bacterium GW2011_GWA2_38_24]|uniref:Uncharacterized protein n=1 Tax=Candidatus Daviesbacteria bacterium GW2011_GWA2_38_24 TaxID=1618422 RepID=A0A0G0LZI6_9BACT|nr:MAG: hypothetical protein US86_C0003G0032 [Candidatus Daviesbacteria bacterium GW2011_GWA2_38_24]KKQ80361.1 MAG: hypothetical protein UT01_C0014G0020 [Candidatus Daviesbacteria bacterium GW2011_GWA1_38_7]OGE24667.1 MAG: hypothetical protein A2688_01230 [Candidatus Daviesbacteria bacterium RIFCSPHIGHO2_01_FULL_38_8]
MDDDKQQNDQPETQKEMLSDENEKDGVVEQSQPEIEDSQTPGTGGHMPGDFNDYEVVDIDNAVESMGIRSDDKGRKPLNMAEDLDTDDKEEWEE